MVWRILRTGLVIACRLIDWYDGNRPYHPRFVRGALLARRAAGGVSGMQTQPASTFGKHGKNRDNWTLWPIEICLFQASMWMWNTEMYSSPAILEMFSKSQSCRKIVQGKDGSTLQPKRMIARILAQFERTPGDWMKSTESTPTSDLEFPATKAPKTLMDVWSLHLFLGTWRCIAWDAVRKIIPLTHLDSKAANVEKVFLAQSLHSSWRGVLIYFVAEECWRSRCLILAIVLCYELVWMEWIVGDPCHPRIRIRVTIGNQRLQWRKTLGT